MPATSEFRLFGSYSEGTLRIQDLLPAAIAAADDLAKWIGETPQDLADAIAEARRAVVELESLDDDDEADSFFEFYGELCDAIQAHCPPYVLFGSDNGDGAWVGFLIDWESLDPDRQFGEVANMNDQGGVDDPGATLALHVNDHGNATLHARDSADSEWRIVWGVV